jgi:phosphoribosyl 1,2-cyclic phosphodiesterase
MPMKVKVWGCRGSIPVPDSRMITYGGNTTCLEVLLDRRVLIIDSGTGIRRLGDDLLRRRIHSYDLFITHSHWDHIQGFPFFKPIYDARTRIRISGCTNSYRQLRTIFTNQMSYEYFPISFADLKSRIEFTDSCDERFTLDGYEVHTLQVNHPIYTLGIRIQRNDSSFVFITDNELLGAKPGTPWESFVEFCAGATYLIHDAQFFDAEYPKRRGWGHSTFEQALRLARDARVVNLGFFHHDPNREDGHLDRIKQRFQALGAKGPHPVNVFVVRELEEYAIT